MNDKFESAGKVIIEIVKAGVVIAEATMTIYGAGKKIITNIKSLPKTAQKRITSAKK